MKIQDGSGSGFLAKVDEDNRLATRAVQISQTNDIAATSGEVFLFASNILTITTIGTETGIVYIKNNSSTDSLFLTRAAVGGTDNQTWRFYKNVSTGTLITGGTDTTPQSTNTSSGATFDGEFLVGGEGFTLTDGTFMSSWVGAAGSVLDNFNASVVISPGTTVAATVEIETNPTDIFINIIAFMEEV